MPRKSSKRDAPRSFEEQLAAAELAAAAKPPQANPDRLSQAFGLEVHHRPEQAIGLTNQGLDKPRLGALPIEDEAYALKLAGYQAYEVADHLNHTRLKGGKLLSEAEAEALIVTATGRRRRSLNGSVADQFQVELDRIEKLIGFLWKQSEQGNVNAVDRVIKLMARKASMLALDAPEVRLTVHASANDLDYSRLSTEELRMLKDLMARATNSGPKEKTIEGHVVESKSLEKGQGVVP